MKKSAGEDFENSRIGKQEARVRPILGFLHIVTYVSDIVATMTIQ